MKVNAIVVLMLAAYCGLIGCSAAQIYNSGQGWKQQQCAQILDDKARADCLSTAKVNYDDYKKQADQVNSKD